MNQNDEDILIELLKKVTHPNTTNNGKITLVETKGNPYHVDMKNVPDDCFVIKIDEEFIKTDLIFQCNNNECMCADYIIVCPSRKCILYIELKKGNIDFNAIVNQLKGAKCVLDYIKSIGQTFWEGNSFLRGYQDRYVAIGKIPVSKKSVKKKFELMKGKVNDTPDKALKVTRTSKVNFFEIAKLNAKYCLRDSDRSFRYLMPLLLEANVFNWLSSNNFFAVPKSMIHTISVGLRLDHPGAFDNCSMV